jgi:hypothetical protein
MALPVQWRFAHRDEEIDHPLSLLGARYYCCQQPVKRNSVNPRSLWLSEPDNPVPLRRAARYSCLANANAMGSSCVNATFAVMLECMNRGRNDQK